MGSTINQSSPTIKPNNKMQCRPITVLCLSLQERFQVKNPPSAYLEKLKSHLDHGGVSRKVNNAKNDNNKLTPHISVYRY